MLVLHSRILFRVLKPILWKSAPISIKSHLSSLILYLPESSPSDLSHTYFLDSCLYMEVSSFSSFKARSPSSLSSLNNSLNRLIESFVFDLLVKKRNKVRACCLSRQKALHHLQECEECWPLTQKRWPLLKSRSFKEIWGFKFECILFSWTYYFSTKVENSTLLCL